MRVSPELFEVLGLFDKWRGLTHGALDASAETITRVWKRAAAENRLPSQVELNAAVAGVRQAHWKLDAVNRTATHTSDAPLAMNSFVKSYIAGHAADAALRASGAQGLVVNIGGDLVVRGDWSEPVDVADPKSDAENGAPIARIEVRDRAVATSGDYRRGVEIGGRHYSHIVDPRTGMPAGEIISSTVIARNAADAGALATAFSVLSPEESARLAGSMPGVEYLLVKKNGERIESSGWSALAAPGATRVAAFRPAATFQRVSAHPGASQWDPKYQLTVTIQLSEIEGTRVHRPYVAVWIEDEDHAPVRTIALWFAKYKYLHELQGLEPRREPALGERGYAHHEFGFERHAPSRQVHVCVGRERRFRQSGESRKIQRDDRSGARARHVSGDASGDGFQRLAQTGSSSGRGRDCVGDP